MICLLTTTYQKIMHLYWLYDLYVLKHNNAKTSTFVLHIVNPERNGKTGKSMKRANRGMGYLHFILTFLHKKCAIFKFNFILEMRVLSE